MYKKIVTIKSLKDAKILKMPSDRLLELLDEASSYLIRESQLVKIQSENDALVVGDTHGDLQSTISSFNVNAKIRIFLGDYVDRGPQQLENINYLLLRLLNEDNIILLRGNHESPLMNRNYGFLMEVFSAYSYEGEEVYDAYVKVFSRMPYAALINGKIFLLHGGLAKDLVKVSQIENLPKDDIEPSNSLAFQILWNDPDEGVEEFAPSPRGEGIYLFGRKVVENFIKNNELEAIIRAHEFYPLGIRTLFDGKVVTIFSCRFYPIEGPKALLLRRKDRVVVKLS